MHSVIRTSALLSLALLANACTDESTDPAALEFRTTMGCTVCGLNSPSVNDYPIPELHLDSVPNESGVRLIGILRPDNTPFILGIVDDEFVAVDGNSNTIVAEGPQLVDWKLLIQLPDMSEQYIQITGIDQGISSWALDGGPLTGYALAYEDPVSGEMYNVCPDVKSDPMDIAVTLIGGERYDREAKTVLPNQDLWFTIACRDEAVYKMKLMNYGPNDGAEGGKGEPASVAQRQATIKMLTADYCGNGTSYTEQGTPLYWLNQSGTVEAYSADPTTPPIEALWNEYGAICLSTPRLVDREDVECNIPVCDSSVASTHEWTTWVP